MRIFYYVVHPQLEQIDDFQETNGWKDIDIYHIVDNQLKHFGRFETPLDTNSKDEVLDFINQDIAPNEIIKLELL